MSVTYGFYNSINGDRKYNALEMSSIFDGIIIDGVLMTIGDALKVTATTGLGFTIGEGRAWFNHTWTLNDSLLPMTLDISDVLMNRIDAVVLEINNNSDVRKNEFKIIKGTPGSNPLRPTLVKSELVNQYPLAYIAVNKGVTSITQANITNMVGTSSCPYVTGPLKGMDIDALIAQWETQFSEFMDTNETEFDTWFQHMKDQLSEDAAGNLQTQIDQIETDVDGKAPKNHASEESTYGVGNGTHYGHVRLTDAITASTASQGVAATPGAVKQAYDRGSTGITNAATAQSTANAAMPKSGGTFTGTVAAKSANTTGAYIRNIRVQNAAGTFYSTNFIIMVRK